MRIGIVGAGQGGCRVLSVLKSLPEVEVAGVVDRDFEAPGIKLADKLGIPTGNDISWLLQQPNLSMVIEVT
ncbi:MAG: chemotaxis protein, partial [Firmicutes bacterium]|nr:chemotaxis protein [Bacillota bacterium]